MCIIFFIVLGVIIFVLIYTKYCYSYWSRRGIPYFEPSFPFGNIQDALLMKRNLAEVMKDLYLKVQSDFAGMYIIFRPALIIRDRNLLKRILVDDFDHFTDRVADLNIKNDPIMNNMYYLCGEKWKNMREKMAPAFASDKLPMMFKTVYDIGMALQGYMGCLVDENENNVIDIRDLSARYLTDVIASVAFGIEVDSIHDPATYFRRIGARIADPNCNTTLMAYFLQFMAPKLFKFMGCKIIDNEIEEFMIETVRQTLQFREKHKFSREDFMQILIQMRNGVDMTETGNEDRHFNILEDKLKHLSIEDCAAQVFIYLAIGFDPASLLISMCLFELAQNPTVMEKLQKDVDDTLNKHNWKLTCECIKDMKYLKQCMEGEIILNIFDIYTLSFFKLLILESLRLYPPCSDIPRICTKNYKIPNSKVVIEKGTCILISVFGMQRDPRIYPNPNKFDPSRFGPEEKAKRPPVDFLPFGLGPRACIGNIL